MIAGFSVGFWTSLGGGGGGGGDSNVGHHFIFHNECIVLLDLSCQS